MIKSLIKSLTLDKYIFYSEIESRQLVFQKYALRKPMKLERAMLCYTEHKPKLQIRVKYCLGCKLTK